MAKIKVYNDGVAWICIQKEKERDFTAHSNPVTMEDIERKGKIFFAISSIRSEDLEFAERASKNLTMKIRIPICPIISKKNKLLIEDVLYDIFRIDIGADKTEMFVFMEEVRRLA